MTTSEGVRLSSLLQIAMRLQDVDRAVAFYRDVLGCRFLFQVPNLAFFDLDGVRLMLDKPESAEFDHPGSILYFRVEDIRAAYDSLRSRGAEFIDEPHIVHSDDRHELWMGFFKDTEGNHLAVACGVPR
jgi:predicted enzyme related to lactoylglutathione lyase